MSKTTITIQTSTKQRLAKNGRFGQSFDSLINEILERLENE